jgi:hypothetical protein
MEDEGSPNGTAPSETKQPDSKPSWKTVAWVVWDTIFALVRLAPVAKHLREVELHHVSKVPVLLFCVLVLGGIGGCWVRGSVANKNEATQRTNYSVTNSLLAGALTESSNQTQRLERQLDKNQQDHSAHVLQLTLDSQESKREKDVEILRVIGERDAARHDLAQFQTIPSNFMAMYTDLTNAAKLFVQDPQTTRQLGRIESLTTNLLSSLQQPSPKFSVSVDGVTLTDTNNNQLLFHPMNPGNLKIFVSNVGGISAEHLTVDLYAPLDSTNVLAPDWQLQANGAGTLVVINQTNNFPNLGHWVVESTLSIANEVSFKPPNFTILTNASGRIVPLFVMVHSDRTKLQRFEMTLLLVPGG